MNKVNDKNAQRVLRHARVRSKISGTSLRPRLSVYRSTNEIYCQVIDDEKQICDKYIDAIEKKADVYIIDGKECSRKDVEALNTTDIESVDVLKDAASTSLFGEKGKDGAIIIKTKNAKDVEPVFEVKHNTVTVKDAEGNVLFETEGDFGTEIDYSELEEPTKEGYDFVGWALEPNGEVVYGDGAALNHIESSGDITLYAKWHISGALFGTFTVNSSGKKVYFAKGNLWYGKASEEAESATFNFEENQYGYSVKYDGKHRCFVRDEDHISHFMWSKNANVSLAVNYDDLSASDNDVFFTNASQTTSNPNFTVNGQKGVWRALSNEEAFYLFNHHD